MALDSNSTLGAIAASIKISGGKAPYFVSMYDPPNDFLGLLDVASTDADDTFHLILNANGVGNVHGSALEGRLSVIDAQGRSATFDTFTIPLSTPSIAPVTGSFFDDAELDDIIISLAAVNAASPVVWEIVSGFDNGGPALLTIQNDGSMTLNSDGVTYYGANPGDGALSGFVTFTDSDGRSPAAPVEIILNIFAHATATVAQINLVHTIG